MDMKIRSVYMLSKRDSFHIWLAESEGMKKGIPCKWIQKESCSILISDKIELKDYNKKQSTWHSDKGINPTRRHNSLKYIFTQGAHARLYPTLCNPLDYSPPCSSVHGIFPDRNTGVDCHSSSRGSSWPRDRTCVSFIAGRSFIR